MDKKEPRETNPIATIDVYLRSNRVHIHAEDLERRGALYYTEVDGDKIHQFQDENNVTNIKLLSYYSTALEHLTRALIKKGISLEGLGREAAWNIIWAKITE